MMGSVVKEGYTFKWNRYEGFTNPVHISFTLHFPGEVRIRRLVRLKGYKGRKTLIYRVSGTQCYCVANVDGGKD